ncbi:MAG: hypothetical protein RhofKO_35010 [Rhodothermales bacterium]
MKRTYALYICLLALAFPFVLTPIAHSQTVDELLDAHAEALGGYTAMQEVQSLLQEGTMILQSPLSGSMEGTVMVAVVPEQRIYHASKVGAYSTTQAWDGTTAWEQGAQGFRLLEGEEAARLRVQAHPFFLHTLRQDEDVTLERQPDEIIDEQQHFVLRFTDAHTFYQAYLNADTYLVSQIVSPLTIPGMGETFIVTDLWDHEVHHGVTLPTSVTVSIEGVLTTELTFTKTTVNEPMDAQLFARPQ